MFSVNARLWRYGVRHGNPVRALAVSILPCKGRWLALARRRGVTFSMAGNPSVRPLACHLPSKGRIEDGTDSVRD